MNKKDFMVQAKAGVLRVRVDRDESKIPDVPKDEKKEPIDPEKAKNDILTSDRAARRRAARMLSKVRSIPFKQVHRFLQNEKNKLG